jgi:hypothetical protein
MASTTANHQPVPIVLKDLIDLKGFIDVDWRIPKTEVRKVLDEKAEEGSIDISHWRSAVKYAYDRYHFVDAEGRFLIPRVKEINSMYGRPKVKLMMRKWISEEMEKPLSLGFGIRSHVHINELEARRGLVELVVKRAVTEFWVMIMKRGIQKKMEHPTEWGESVEVAPEDEIEAYPLHVEYTL